MKNYERFIVYPLLFIALFYSVGDQFVSSASNVIDQIIARNITIVDERGNKVVEISSHDDGGQIKLNNTQNEYGISIMSTNSSNFMNFYKPNGTVLNGKISISANTLESSIKVYSPDKEVVIPFTEPSIRISSRSNENLVSILNPKDEKGDTSAIKLLASQESNIVAVCDQKNQLGAVLYADTTYHGLDVISPGGINLRNSHEDLLVSIGQTTKGHGSVFTYDKYGDQYRSYGFYQ